MKKKRFIPAFTDIVPTANLTSPTILRQLEQLLVMMERLIEETDKNFVEFDEYIVKRLNDIEAGIAEIVESVTADTVEDMVAEEISKQLDDLIKSIDEVSKRVINSEQEIAWLTDEANSSSDDIDELTKALSDVRLLVFEIKEDMDDVLVESKAYTDGEIDKVKELIPEEQPEVDLTEINNHLDELDSEIERLDQRIDDVSSTGEGGGSEPSAVLEMRVRDLENDYEQLRRDVDELQNNSEAGDLSEIMRSIESLKADIDTVNDMALSNGYTIHDIKDDMIDMYSEIDGIKEQLSNIDGESGGVPEELIERVNDIDERVVDLEAEYSELSLSFDTLNAYIRDELNVEEQLMRYGDRISALELRMDELTSKESE